MDKSYQEYIKDFYLKIAKILIKAQFRSPITDEERKWAEVTPELMRTVHYIYDQNNMMWYPNPTVPLLTQYY